MMLIVNCVSFMLDNSLESFVVVFNKSHKRLLSSPSSFFFGESLKLLQILGYSGMDLGLQFTTHIFDEIQLMTLCRPVSNFHCGLLEVVLHQEQDIFGVDPVLLLAA